MTKIKMPSLYKIGRGILGPIYRWWYKPTIIGKENIIKDGSAIIASDHIHLFDQCSLIISTKRYITYMAKKEYFDSKKTAWFFKRVGCIPVDRTHKDTNATDSALDVLKNGGMIGIFPEGTRNALKDERIKVFYDKYFKNDDFNELCKKIYENKIMLSSLNYMEKLYNDKVIKKSEFINNFTNANNYLYKLYKENKISKSQYLESRLLDLKFGTVSMANKTDSYIIPVCITGEYKFRGNNLVVNIGIPFKVENNDLEKANNKLRSEILKLMEENLKDIL